MFLWRWWWSSWPMSSITISSTFFIVQRMIPPVLGMTVNFSILSSPSPWAGWSRALPCWLSFRWFRPSVVINSSWTIFITSFTGLNFWFFISLGSVRFTFSVFFISFAFEIWASSCISASFRVSVLSAAVTMIWCYMFITVVTWISRGCILFSTWRRLWPRSTVSHVAVS